MAADHPMKATRSRLAGVLLVGCIAAALANSTLLAEEVEAIASKTAKDYVRKKLPDGTYQPETYTFGKGDNLGGARVDESADSLGRRMPTRLLLVQESRRLRGETRQ